MAALAAQHETPGLRDFRVADYVRAITPQIPTTLISVAAQHEIIRVAAQLPGAITSFFGFECPLGNASADADFLLCSTREEAHSRILAGAHPGIDLPAELLTLPAWQRIRAFCQAWERADSPLHGSIMNTWLEFDIASATQTIQNPSLFFGTQPPVPGEGADARLALIREALVELEPEAIRGVRDSVLQRCIESLPAGSYAFQIGAMWSRATGAIRVCVRSIAPNAVVSLLETLDWPGSLPAVTALVSTLAPLALRLDVDIDLGASIGPKLGIECYFGTDAETAARLRRASDYLVADGLCTPEKADALLRYSGLTHQDAPTAAWPLYLRSLATDAGPGVASCLLRWIHHIKVVHEPGRPTGAKAYLAVEHHLLDRRRLHAALHAAHPVA